jgi:Family of unknown function (DUF6172)
MDPWVYTLALHFRQPAHLACLAASPENLSMKKVYALQIEGKNPERVLEATKHDIRKYVKRCRKISLPEGVDFWDFDCKVGADKDSATSVHLAELIAQLDVVAKAGHASAYVEVEAKNGLRVYVPGAAKVDNPDEAAFEDSQH